MIEVIDYTKLLYFNICDERRVTAETINMIPNAGCIKHENPQVEACLAYLIVPTE